MDNINFKITPVISVLAVTVSIAAQIILFRVATPLVGLETIGLFGLVQAFMIFGRLMEAGAGPNITRRVALLRKGSADAREIWRVLLAGFAIVSFPTLLASTALIFPIHYYIVLRHSSAFTSELIFLMVVFGAIAGSLASIATILLAGIEGHGALITRNIIWIVSSLIAPCVGIPAMTVFGEIGFAVAMVSALLVQTLLGAAVLLIKYPTGLRGSFSGITPAIREQFYENITMNVIGLLRLTFEPMTKILLSYTSGLSLVATFDVLNRIALSLRQLLQGAVHPLLVYGSRESDRYKHDDMEQTFLQAHNIAGRVSVFLGIGMMVSAPLVTVLLFSAVSNEPINIIAVLGLASAVNMAGVVGYYHRLSSGNVSSLIGVHVAMFGTNLLGGLGFGFLFGGMGVIAAYGLTFTVGGLLSLSLLRDVIPQTIIRIWMRAWGIRYAALFFCAVCFALASPEATRRTGEAPMLIVSLSLSAVVAFMIISYLLPFFLGKGVAGDFRDN